MAFAFLLLCETRISAVLSGTLLKLEMVPKVFEELEVKRSIVVHHDQVTHLLLNQ